MISRIYIAIIYVSLFHNSIFAQRPSFAESGKCYAKCLISSKPAEEGILQTIKYPVYIGTDPSVKTKEVQILVIPEKTYWTKKRELACKFSDPDECMVWCLVIESEAVHEYVKVPKRLNKIPGKDIIWRSFDIPYSRTARVGEFREWREILCKKVITPDVLENIAERLWQIGYDIPDHVTLAKITEPLMHYQRSEGLPIGALDYETLKSLRIPF